MSEFAQRVGHNLQRLREERGVSRERLAVLLDKSEGAIRHYEKGRALVPLPVIEKIAEFFGVSPLVMLFDPEHASMAERHLKILDSLSEEDLVFLEGVLSRLEKNKD